MLDYSFNDPSDQSPIDPGQSIDNQSINHGGSCTTVYCTIVRLKRILLV